jgi:hypothetical protein
MKLVIYTLLMIALGFLLMEWIDKVNASKDKTENYRGCIVSAYQAEKNGFSLEANLDYCEKEFRSQ